MRALLTALTACYCALLVVPNGCSNDSPDVAAPGTTDQYGPIPKTIGGFAVTHGAAAGYIDDASCKECHQQLYDSYQSVGMARSFYPPSQDRIVEDLGKTFHHPLTGHHYQMSFRGGKLYQKRYRLDEQQQPFAELETEVAWIIGSGKHVRSYFSHSAHGELFQLPMSWYAEDGWGMSPGYDREQHFGFERRVSRHCMFCHNAYPEVPTGTDLQHVAPLFPAHLPHGIGCQRCHGPGARHVEKALDDNATDAEIRQRIENPKNHPPEVRDQLCMTCHLQPETLADGQMLPRAFDKPLYSHRPEQRISEWIEFLDHGTEAERRDRTQVNHHAYRLRFSKCHTESEGQLGCTTCHDPHKLVPVTDRPAFYRKKCLQCHQLTDCSEKTMGHGTDPAQSDCVACHMVKTRPADVVHVTMTDHFIRRKRPIPDPAAPRPEQRERPAPPLVTPYFPATEKTAKWRVLAGLASAGSASQADLRAWQQAFADSEPHPPAAYAQVGRALGRRDRAAAIDLLREGVARHPEVAELYWELGDALWMTGRATEAVAHLDTADRLSAGGDPDIAKSLGIACSLTGELPRARDALERSLRMRPNDRTSWLQLASTLVRMNDLPSAAVAFERALKLVPDHVDAYRGLSGIYGRLGRPADALRVLRQGASFLPAIRLDLIALHCLSSRPEHRDPGAALRLAEAAIREAAEDPRSLLHLALARVFTSPPKAAQAAIDAAAAAGADPPSCEALRALVYRNQGETKPANACLDRFNKGLGTASREPLRNQLAGFLQSLAGAGRRNR